MADTSITRTDAADTSITPTDAADPSPAPAHPSIDLPRPPRISISSPPPTPTSSLPLPTPSPSSRLRSPRVFSPEYAAFFAPRTHIFETVDIRTSASAANLRALVPTSSSSHRRASAFRLALAALVGLIVGLINLVSDQLSRATFFVIFGSTKDLLRSSFPLACLATLGSSVALVTAGSLMSVFIAPQTAGSGIPQLKAVLNGVRVPGFLALRSMLVKIVGVSISSASGLVSGRQGALGHIGAVVGAGMSQGAGSEFGWRFFDKGALERLYRPLRTEREKLNFAAIGAAVGVATTFIAPMGGWMWIYEEAVTHWDWNMGFQALCGTIVGVGVLSVGKFVAGGMNGGFSDFTFAKFGRLVDSSKVPLFPFKDLPGYILLGVIGGVLGAILPWVSQRITLIRYRFSHPIYRVSEVAFVVLLTNTIRILVPFLAGDCRAVERGVAEVMGRVSEQDYSRFDCVEGEYSVYALVFYNPGLVVVRSMIYIPGSQTIPVSPLAFATLFYTIMVIWSFGLPVPGGVFAPAFTLGSVYGRLVGVLVQKLLPGRTDVSVEGYAFVGVVSALSGISRGVSVSVIALECTGLLSASYVAVLIAFVSRLVGDNLHRLSVYATHIKLKGMPFLEDVVPSPELYYRVRVDEIMSTSIVSVRCKPRVSELVETLMSTEHHAFPVFYKNSLLGGRNSNRTTPVVSGNIESPIDSRTSGDPSFSSSGSNSGSGEMRPDGTLVKSLSVVDKQVQRYAPYPSEHGDGDPKHSPGTGDEHTVAFEDEVDVLEYSIDDRARLDTDSDRLEEEEDPVVALESSITHTPDLEQNVGSPELAGMIDFHHRHQSVFSPSAIVCADQPLNLSTRIVMASGPAAFSASLFENGTSRHIQLGQDRVADRAKQSQSRSPPRSPSLAPNRSSGNMHVPTATVRERTTEVLVPEYSLFGIIDRATVLALLENAVDAQDSKKRGCVERNCRDAAWPNNKRAKDSGQEELLQRVKAADIDEKVIDLRDYLDPDPLLISDRAMAYAAYKLFQRTGARHILVNNIREGHVAGMVTRKDVLPESIIGAITRMRHGDPNASVKKLI